MKFALIGNPNVGKSVFFGFLTGRRTTVSNYPGTTIEVASGTLSIDGVGESTLMDTPGINSLVPLSEEEEITRNILVNGKIDAVIQIADSKNLQRALFITLQLIEMKIPFLLALNMQDEAMSRGIHIDTQKLSSILGIPVIPTIAIQKKGLKEIKAALPHLSPSSFCLSYPPRKVIRILLKSVLVCETRTTGGWGEKLGRLAMHPVWGVGILILVLAAFYGFVGKFGAQIAVSWMEEGLFGQWISPGATRLFREIFFYSPFLQNLFVGPYGLITMALTYALAIIFPIVLTFFIAFSLIEDSGYLPRLAILLDRIFRWMGLNGKAVIPMILGLGCDTMATMTARVLDTRKEKIIVTLLLALGVPCSAQLGIILGMLGALPLWSTFVWSGIVIGSLISVGFLASKILPGTSSGFIMEVPPLRRPVLTNILSKTLARLEWYLKEVVPLFILGTLILFVLDALGWIPRLEALASPLVTRFLKLPPQAAEAFLIGFLRRDYGATRFFDLFSEGKMDAIQTTTALIVMTLFVPCLANTLMIIKERGLKIAAAIVLFIYPYAFLVGGLVSWGMRL